VFLVLLKIQVLLAVAAQLGLQVKQVLLVQPAQQVLLAEQGLLDHLDQQDQQVFKVFLVLL
jgi:hypothetical protein